MSEPITLGAGGLSVVLSRLADRYRHEVLVTTDEARVVLASLEGTDDQVWPPSPPFQELHTHQSSKDVEAALLVGRAGRSHWSASIEVDSSQETVVFDIACRLSGPSDWLGSRYRCLVEPTLAPVAESRTFLLASNLELEALEGEARVSEKNQAHMLLIAPIYAVSSRVQTIRWRYRVRNVGSHTSG